MLPVLVVLLMVSAQRPIVPPPQRPVPEPASRTKPTQHKIAVRGCVQNGRLQIPRSLVGELPFDTLNVLEFILEGPKELLQQIQEQHNGHYDEIEGVATVPPPPNDVDAAVETWKKGGVRVAAGRRDEKGPVTQTAPRQIKLKVASLTHIEEGCVPRP